MTMPLMRPKRKNPVLRTRQMNLPPWRARPHRARHDGGRRRRPLRAAGVPGLRRGAVPAARGLPPLPVAAPEVDAADRRRRAAQRRPTLHHSNDLFFRERLPWRLGLVQLDAGPTLMVHLHGESSPATRPRASASARASTAPAQAVLIGFPDEESEHMADDKMLREMTSDPKFRKVLVTDGKTAVGQALVQALVKAGADIVWVGHAEPWKKLPGLDDITRAAAGDAGAARPDQRPAR